MSLMLWKDDYLTGIEDIDEQHRRLFDLLNAIYDMMRSGRGQVAIAEAMSELADYSQFHFQTEEEHMLATEYHLSESHAEEHKKLLEEVRELRREVKDGRIVVSMNVLYFLKDWLLKHFLSSDRGLAAHLRSVPDRDSMSLSSQANP